MNLEDYLAALATNAEMLAAAADNAGPEAALVTCPEWVMRDLVLHIGEVHRWSAAIVREHLVNPAGVPANFLGPLPTDGELVEWFGAGASALADTLRSADPTLQCFTFLSDPPTPLLFWARRQALETAMHRVDAESALGQTTAISSALAADGIDEMLTGFAPRKSMPLRAPSTQTLEIAPTDVSMAWRITISDQSAVTVRTAGESDCSASGLSSDLYQTLWNRQGIENLVVTGDESVLQTFRDNVKIRWG